jgi:hypothetical protein
MNKQFAELKVFELGGIAFCEATETLPFLVLPKGQATIKPWGPSGFVFENIITGDVVAFVSEYDDILDSAGSAYGATQLDVITALAAFFFELGGGAAGDLASVLIAGNASGANDINFDINQGIYFANTSRLREGKIDAGLGGAKGIAQICAVGYELKWEAGRLYVMDGTGDKIRWSLYNFDIAPDVNDDSTKGYYVGSRWTLDDGTVYVCSDVTTGAAVWAIQKYNFIGFDTAAAHTVTEGELAWNDADGTLDLGLKGGNVTLQIGQEQIVRVVNKTATNVNLLEANYQAVRITGAQGQRLKVDLALATTDVLSAETIGLVTETINNNQQGFVTVSGLVRGINTTGSLQTETWADGDILYLSPTTAGNITNVKPIAPNHLIVIGYVVSAHITQGSIYVKVDNGYELDELHNVTIATPANNDALIYETSTALWKNKTIGGWNYIEKTANHDVTNTIIPQDDPELQFSVVANGSYMVEFDFCWSGNNATGDYQGNFAITAGTMSGYGLVISSTSTTPILLPANNAVSAGLTNFNLASTNITFLMTCKVQFNFTCTQNATFKYQLRNVAASVGATSRTWKGAILKYKKIN